MKQTCKIPTVLGDVTVTLSPSLEVKQSFALIDKVSDKDNLHLHLQECEGQLWKRLELQVSMFAVNLSESYLKIRYEFVMRQKKNVRAA